LKWLSSTTSPEFFETLYTEITTEAASSQLAWQSYCEVARWGNDHDMITFWYNICAQYSARQLTSPTDWFPALTSIAKRMHKGELLGDYLAGLWEYILPNGLFGGPI
jgi:hypothetical protein